MGDLSLFKIFFITKKFHSSISYAHNISDNEKNRSFVICSVISQTFDFLLLSLDSSTNSVLIIFIYFDSY